MTSTNPDDAGNPVPRLLSHLARLNIDARFAFTHLVAALQAAPPATPGRLADTDRRALLEDGSLTEEDLEFAERSVANGDFTADLLGQVLIGLSSLITDEQLLEILGVPQTEADALYDSGQLIGRRAAGVTGTPSWLIDTSQPDGLIPHSREILEVDAPQYLIAFGQLAYQPMAALRARVPLSPRSWLAEGLDPDVIVALIETAPMGPS